jgi:hypothetical protein
MKNNKQGLQKLTNTDAKIKKILALEKVTVEDIKQLSDKENEKLNEVLTKKFNTLKGVEIDKFNKKFEAVINPETKNELWENNHIKITNAISTLTQEYGRMPSKAEMAAKTELSRQTVHKHIKEYSAHPLYLAQLERYRFLTGKVLARVFYFAVNGDIGAAKLYLTAMGCLNNVQPPASSMIQNQNNFIQINNTILSQETIKNLSADQLQNIESIIKASLPQMEQADQ